jgi:hypothetical protein
MASKTRLLGRLLCLLLYSQTLVLAVETVSQFGEKWSHPCVERCLGRWAALYDNIGSALQCASPFYNECYCATAAASASKATSYLASCASTSCKAGDITMDLSAMQSLYASYCMENGFTQPGATAWYNPSATETGAPAPGSTTTRLSVVTQTIASDSGGDSSTQPWGKCLLPLAVVVAALLLQVLYSPGCCFASRRRSRGIGCYLGCMAVLTRRVQCTIHSDRRCHFHSLG